MGPLLTILSRSLILFFLLGVTQVATLLTTTIIDDADPAIQYTVGSWIPRSSSQPCTTCAGAGIDPTQAFRGTWHEESDSAQAEFTFFGTGVEIFNIIRNMPGNQSNYTFLVDGQRAGDFVFVGTGGNVWMYNQSVFARRNLPRGQHRMTIIEGTTSFMAFDWALVEDNTPDPTTATSSTTSTSASSATSATTSPSTSSRTPSPSAPPTTATSGDSVASGTSEGSSPSTGTGQQGQKEEPAPATGMIIGAAVGCTVALAVLIALLWWWIRRRKSQGRGGGNPHSASPTPSQLMPRPFDRIRRGTRSNLDMGGDPGPMMEQGYRQSVPWHPPTVSRNATTVSSPGITTRDSARPDNRYQSYYSRSSDGIQQIEPSRREYARPSPNTASRGFDDHREGSSVTSHRTGHSSGRGSKTRVQHAQPVETHIIIHEDAGRPPEAPSTRGALIRVEELPPAYANHDLR